MTQRSKHYKEQATQWPIDWYDQTCTVCPRLSGFLDEVESEFPEYFCLPVPPFGDANAELLIESLKQEHAQTELAWQTDIGPALGVHAGMNAIVIAIRADDPST